VVVTTFNEQEHVAPLLANIAWADEIVVVDSFSTDDTVSQLRANALVRLHQRAYKGPADQKNWAIEQATHPWILLMDADERISPELMSELENWRKTEPKADAYTIRFRTHFMGHAVQYSGWQNDKAVRLIRKSVCRYNQNQVHEDIDTNGLIVAAMKHPFEHFTYKNLDHFLAKMQRYAQWGAADRAKKNTKVTYFHLFLKPVFRFFKHYIFKRGFLDGKVGFIISVLMAWGVFLRYVYLREMGRAEGKK
jgi:glycosyltransferase involved in cell wall biosynthesis